MSEVTMDEISIQIEGNSDKAIESLTRLTGVLDKLTGVTGSSIAGLNQVNGKIKNIANSANKSSNTTNKSFSGMGKSVLGFVTKLAGVKLGFFDTTNAASEFISTYAGFNKVLGTSQKNLDNAKEFVEDLTDAWYLDEQQVMNSMSRYYNMTSTMGFTEDAALRMSRNLTQLSYDLQALGTTGATITEVQNQLSSALRGEAEGLAKFGISLNQATLQTVLYENGINRTVSSLTAAQKAEVIYYQIMRQTYSKHGYYAEQLSKNILQPAMAAQIFQNQMKNLARAIGSIFIPVITAVMPYLIALTQLLTDLAKRIANFFEFEMADWDDGATEDISAGFGDIADSADKAGKKIKGMLGDFDELHTISFNDGSSTGIGAGGSLGLDASQFEYSNKLLEVTNDQLERAKEVIGVIKDYLIAIGIALAGFTIGKSVLNLFGAIFGADEKILDNIVNIAFGIGLIAGGAYLMGDALLDIYENGLTLKNGVELLIGSVATFAGWMIILNALKKIDLYSKLFGNTNILRVAGGLTLVIGALVVFVIALGEAAKGGEEGAKGMAVALGAMAIAAIGFAIAGFPMVGVVIAFTAVILALIGTIQTCVQAIKSLKDPTVEVKSPLENLSDNFKGLTESVGEFTSGITDKFKGTTDSMSENLTAIDELTSGTVNNLDEYLNTDLVKSLENSGLEVQEFKDFVAQQGIELDQLNSESFKSIENNITSKTREAAKQGSYYFDSLVKDIETSNKDLKNDTQRTMKDLTKQTDSTTTALDRYTSKWASFWERGNNAKIKTPSFSWKESINTSLSTLLRTTLSALGLPIMLPTMSVSWFADGGFPTKGDLFVANEAGAEWVGSMNGRTAVANQDQIATGVEEAAYRGMSRALAEKKFGGTKVYNYLDSKQIASKMVTVQESNDNMYG